MKALILAVLLCLSGPQALWAGDFENLRGRLAADGVSSQELDAIFKSAWVKFEPQAMGQKLMDLYTRKYGSELIRKVQTRLSELEYYFSDIDGKANYLTKAGIRAFQKQHSLPEDGTPSPALYAALKAERAKAPPELGLRGLTQPPTPPVYEVILTPERLGEAKDFYDKNIKSLRNLQARYGIAPEVATGLLTVETRVGKYLGKDLAVNNLASMAVSSDFSKVSEVFSEESPTPAQKAWLSEIAAEKSAWAYKELKALLIYAKNNQLDLSTMPGSIHGAIGICQFMPSSVLIYGVDGNGDGRIDLFNLDDALCSMGNYLQAHGVKGSLSDEKSLRKALYGYNHSQVYVNSILAVAEYLKTGKVQQY